MTWFGCLKFSISAKNVSPSEGIRLDPHGHRLSLAQLADPLPIVTGWKLLKLKACPIMPGAKVARDQHAIAHPEYHPHSHPQATS
jgi:hypothetical protein